MWIVIFFLDGNLLPISKLKSHIRFFYDVLDEKKKKKFFRLDKPVSLAKEAEERNEVGVNKAFHKTYLHIRTKRRFNSSILCSYYDTNSKGFLREDVL